MTTPPPPAAAAAATPAPKSAMATAIAEGKKKTLFVIQLAHDPVHPLVGFTGLNGKMYFSALDVCRLLKARYPEALAEHVGACQMKNVTPFNGWHWMRRDAWVVEYHGLRHLLTTVILDKAHTTFSETPARQLLHFLKHGIVCPAATAAPNQDEDESVYHLKEVHHPLSSRGGGCIFSCRRRQTADTFGSTNSSTTGHHPQVGADPSRCRTLGTTHLAAAGDHPRADLQAAAAAADDDEEGDAGPPVAEEGVTPAPSSVCMPFVLWKFEQQSQMVFQGL